MPSQLLFITGERRLSARDSKPLFASERRVTC
jgi:hypothetical protein